MNDTLVYRIQLVCDCGERSQNKGGKKILREAEKQNKLAHSPTAPEFLGKLLFFSFYYGSNIFLGGSETLKVKTLRFLPFFIGRSINVCDTLNSS